MARASKPSVRKEVIAVYRRTNSRKKSKALEARTAAMIRPGIKVVALVSILGISAYLLFSPKTTEPQRVSARQPETRSAPQTADTPAPLPPVTNPTGQESTSPATTSSESVPSISGLPAVLEQATPTQRETAKRLLNFATTGSMSEIRSVSPDEVRSVAELVTTQLGTQQVAAAVESYFGLSAAGFLARSNAPQALTELFEAVQRESDPATAGPVVFTDQVRPDGSVAGNVHVIPAGTKRVYATFENKGGLQGLDHVLAVWRNPSDDRMVFTEYEPVRVGAVYNYVWLQLNEGWPSGYYQLDLFNPSKTSELLASRSFNVR